MGASALPGVVLAALLAGSTTRAQGDDPGWSWRVAPFLWTAGIEGSHGIGPAEFDFDVDFSDIWDNLESAGLVFVEARREDVAILGDVVYLGLDLDGETALGGDVDADVDTTILELASLYQLPGGPFELGAGLRYLQFESDLEVGPVTTSGESDAFDGFAAARASWELGERWSLQAYGDVGAGESDLTWQAWAMLGLQFTRWGLGLGYRILDYDLEEGSEELDLSFEGFVYGVEFRF